MINSLKNSRSFWNWQGNSWNYPGNYLKFFVLGIIVLIVVLIFVFRTRIQNRFTRGGKILFFKSDIVMWQTIGAIGLLFSIIRMTLFIVYGFPRYWENLQLHLCRMHIWIIFALLVTKKIKLFKYILLMSLIGSILGILFFVGKNTNLGENQQLWTSKISGSGFNLVDINVDKISDNKYFLNSTGTKIANNFEVLAIFDNFKYYNLGLDNFIIYDIYFSHISLVFFPFFIFIAYKLEYKIIHLIRTQIIYLTTFFFLWLLNIALNYAPDIHWRSNIWYVGMDRNNDYRVFKKLSSWPQNVFVFSLIGIFTINFLYFIGLQIGQIQFYNKGKYFWKPTIKRVKNFQKIKSQFYKGVFKEAVFPNRKSKNV